MQTISRRKLIEELNILCNELDEKYGINSGGCCYLTYVIAKHLDRLNIPYELVIASSEWKDQSAINIEVKNKKIHYVFTHSVTGENTCNHYFIHLKYVGSINYDHRKYSYKISDINYKNIKWIYKNGLWNDFYETRYNSVIGKIIKNFFKQYEISA